MGAGRIASTLQKTFPERLRAVRETVLWVLRLRTRHKVVNASMEPAASPGDYVLVNPNAYRSAMPKPGDFILARHPANDTVITKRVASVVDNQIEVVSDNLLEGQDSRHFGPLPLTLLRGRVTCVIR